MVILSHRVHSFEIHEQSWCPQFVREKVQSCLTLFWTVNVPLLQRASPAQHVARILHRVLGEEIKDYLYVDFCAGAGGPIPTIEQELNFTKTPAAESNSPAQFVLTDLHPYIPEWTKLAKRNENITFIKDPIDATDVPTNLIGREDKKIFRLYNLAFHHFDDRLGSNILHNTLDTADGFGIFELQERTISSLVTIMFMGLVLFFLTPFYFWKSPGHLFFTYIIPIIPFVVVVDGYTSSLRTRRYEEIIALIDDQFASKKDWKFYFEREQHTWPTGYITSVVGVRRRAVDQTL